MSFAARLREMREMGLEFVTGRYYSKYLGVVEDAADPQGQGRVRVSCRVATGRSNPIAQWAHPSADYAGSDKGMFFPPDEGDLVWVWFDQGKTTVPRYSGSWWPNRSQDKTPDGSHVPAEFNPGTQIPKKRGIKTKAGHGLLFEDTEDANKVELWTGEQGDTGTAAVRKHQVRLDGTKKEEMVEVRSAEGHRTQWIDKEGEHAISSKTKKEHEVTISDEDDKITVKTVGNYRIEVDQKTKKITIQTGVGQTIELLDDPPSINVMDSTGNSVKLTPAGVDVTSTAAVSVNAVGAATIAATGAVAVTSGGSMSLSGGGGMSVASSGGPANTTAGGVSTSTFVGLKTETFLGGLVQGIAGAWSVVAAGALIAGLTPGSILLGSLLGVKFKLVDERALIWLAAHTHTAIGVGLPTSTPIEPILSELMTTNYMRAD